MAKVLSSFFEVSYREVKVDLKVAAARLTWVNFVFAFFSALAFSGCHLGKIYNQ